MEIETLYPAQCYLGESPLWHETRKSCLWVDIENGILYELNWLTQKMQTWDIGCRVSVIIEHHDGDLVLGVQGGIVKFSFDDGNITWLTDIEKDIRGKRCNDGACDVLGRIWVGVMDIHAAEEAGSLYCIHHDLLVEKMLDGLTIPNGLAWSIDHERMYFTDSSAGDVKSYLFNKQTGVIGFEKIAITIPKELGVPDGLTIDEQGMLWVAVYGGSRICRYNPESGELLYTINLPVPNVTNCCFAGENLEHLIITTARENMNEQQLKQYPESGDVFIVWNVGVSGIKNKKAVHVKQ